MKAVNDGLDDLEHRECRDAIPRGRETPRRFSSASMARPYRLRRNSVAPISRTALPVDLVPGTGRSASSIDDEPGNLADGLRHPLIRA